MRAALSILIATALLTAAVFSHTVELLAPMSFALRVAGSMLALGPLAFCLGMPFPLALARVGQQYPGLVPWAWGVNGCASVVGPILALLLALHWGLTAVVVVAVGLYATTLLSTP